MDSARDIAIEDIFPGDIAEISRRAEAAAFLLIPADDIMDIMGHYVRHDVRRTVRPRAGRKGARDGDDGSLSGILGGGGGPASHEDYPARQGRIWEIREMTTHTPESILATLTGVFREVFDDDALTLTLGTTAEDIEEWDSLNQIKLIIGCEKAFEIRLKPREINALQNIGEMVDHLSAHLSRP